MKSKLMEEQSCNAVAAEYIPPSSSSSLLPLPYSQSYNGGGGERGDQSDTHGYDNNAVYGMLMADSSYLPNRCKKYSRWKEVSIEADAEEGKEKGEGGHYDEEDDGYGDDDIIAATETGGTVGGNGVGGGTSGKRARHGGVMEAVLHGNEGNLGRMLGERKADVDVIDQGGATPLMLAAQTGKVDMVQLLLDYHASVTARTTMARNSVMHFAAKNGSEAVIKLLMERDTTLLDSPNKNLDTPLMMAVLARK